MQMLLRDRVMPCYSPLPVKLICKVACVTMSSDRFKHSAGVLLHQAQMHSSTLVYQAAAISSRLCQFVNCICTEGLRSGQTWPEQMILG